MILLQLFGNILCRYDSLFHMFWVVEKVFGSATTLLLKTRDITLIIVHFL